MKTRIEDLAMFGGAPLFRDAFHVGRPNVPDQDRLLARIRGILERRWLTNDGPVVREFERNIAGYLGAKHCVAMCNGTVALEVAARALGLAGEVIVPSFTFIATAHALEWIGLTPVFCDVDPKTHGADPASVERLITGRTTGIVGVHVWGQASHAVALAELARRHRLQVLFDAAHAFGCSHQGRMLGNFGRAEVFSFHATKFFNTFEGGAVVTNDDELAAKLRLMRNFGFAGYDHVVTLGTNGKMSEVCAAMGLAGLEALPEVLAVNRRNYDCYRQELQTVPGLRLVTYDETERQNYQYVVLEVDGEPTALDRDTLLRILWVENVLARRYFYPGCHRMEPYRSRSVGNGGRLPATERLAERVLVLPTGTAVGVEDIRGICGLIKLVMSRSADVRARLDVEPPARSAGEP